MSGCVTVTGPPASICALNFGTTEPLEASTLPNRTAISRIGRAARLRPRREKSASSAWQYISAKRLVAPSTDTGSIALSVEIITIAAAPAAAAASATLTEPKTLVLTPSSQFSLEQRHVLERGGMKDDVGLEFRHQPEQRARGRGRRRCGRRSAAALCLVASVSSTACSAGSEFSMISSRAAPNVITRSQISEPIEPPPPVTTIDLPFEKAFQPPVIDLHARPQQQVLDIDRRQPRHLAAVIERRQPAHREAEPARAHQGRFGLGVRLERRRREDHARDDGAALRQIADHALEIVEIAKHRNAADRLPPIGARRRQHADRPDLAAPRRFRWRAAAPRRRRRGRAPASDWPPRRSA